MIQSCHVSLSYTQQRLQSALRHPLPGAGAAQAGGAGAAGQDGGGSGGGDLAGTAVLQQDVHAAFAAVLPGHHHGRLAQAVLGLHIDPVLRRRQKTQHP